MKDSIKIEIGMRFNKLMVIADSSIRDKSRTRYYVCRCDCGNTKAISRMALVSKDTQSCGCFARSSKQKPAGEASWNLIFYVVTRSAKHRKLEFNLSKSEYQSLASKQCFYCGSAPKLFNTYLSSGGAKLKGKVATDESIQRADIYRNGVDRVDSTLGYSTNNCVSCCFDCNEMKMDRSKEKFLSHVQKIATFQIGQI